MFSKYRNIPSMDNESFVYSFYSFSLFFILEDNCFTILCWPLPYINMNQRQVSTCPLPPESPSHLPLHPTPLDCHRTLGWASSVTQQIPTCYLFYIWQSTCFCTILSIPPILSFPHCVPSLFSLFMSPLLPCRNKLISTHLSRFHTHELIYNIIFLFLTVYSFLILILLILLTLIPLPPFLWYTTLPEYLVQWGNEGLVAGILPYSRCRRECFQQTPCSFMFLYWNIILVLQCFPNTEIYHLWLMIALFIGLKKFKIHFIGLKKFAFIPSLLRVSIINEYSIRVIIHKILRFSISSCVYFCKLHFSRNLYIFWSIQVIIKLSAIFSFLKNMLHLYL